MLWPSPTKQKFLVQVLGRDQPPVRQPRLGRTRLPSSRRVFVERQFERQPNDE